MHAETGMNSVAPLLLALLTAGRAVAPVTAGGSASDEEAARSLYGQALRQQREGSKQGNQHRKSGQQTKIDAGNEF